MIITKCKITLMFCVFAFIFVHLSCKPEQENDIILSNNKKVQDSPDEYISALNSKLNIFIALAENSSEDNIINSDEAQVLNNQKKNLDEFHNEIDKKFKNNPNAQTRIEEFYRPNNEIISRYNGVILALTSCKGAEKLQF
jgi:hypothetical protein